MEGRKSTAKMLGGGVARWVWSSGVWVEGTLGIWAGKRTSFWIGSHSEEIKRKSSISLIYTLKRSYVFV